MGKLFKTYGFLAYIIVVFLNAFTDLGHKIIIQNTVFKVYDGNEQIILTAIVNALMLLPFILLFSPSGYISDKFSKSKVMRISAIVAVVITSLITLCYYLGLFWISFSLTLALAIQSAIYSPAKYGYIKELLGNENLAAANGAVQSATIVAILAGIFFYSIGFESLLDTEDSYQSAQTLKQIAPMGWFLIVGSLVELFFAYKLPDKSKEQKYITFDKKKYVTGGYLKRNMKLITKNQMIWLSIIGLSIFWALSQVVLAIFPSYIKEYLDVTNAAVVQGLMALSGIGIIFGSLLASRVSQNYIEIGIVPIGAIGIFLSIFIIPNIDSLVFIGLNFFLFGVFGGLFIVPLNSLIQFNSSKKRLGLILAGNNFVQNVAMFGFLIATIFISIFQVDVLYIFYLLSLIAILGAIYTIRKLPQSMVKFLISIVISARYKLVVQGLDNVPETKGVLLLGNHISWLDWAMVQMAMPRRIKFVMERSIYEQKYIKWFLDFFGVIPISSTGGRQSLQKVTEHLNKGEVVCVFPEGTISRNGHLGEFKKGFEIAAKDANAIIVPFYLGGLWGTRFSRSNINFAESQKGKRSKDVIVSFGIPLPIDTSSQKLKTKIFELSIDSWDRYVNSLKSIDHSWFENAKRMGSKIAIIDSSGDKFSYYKALALSIIFSNFIKKHKEDTIGLLLPTTSIGAILNLATLISGKKVINLNYTSSSDAVVSAISQSGIKNIYSSKRFIKKLKDKGIDIQSIIENKASILYLEDLKGGISKTNFIATYLLSRFAPLYILKKLYLSNNKLEDTATILFSSGSEGMPKGVILTHKNILANTKQIVDILNPDDNEIFLGSLPMFHAFGLTVTTFLPLLEGFSVVCHPDPTDGVGIGKAVATHNVTFMCATSTFLRLYTKNKRVHPLMFGSLKMVIAGAEKLSKTVRDEFKQKFSLDIYEGYGATECSPVVSCNIPDAIDTSYWNVQIGGKIGSIGMPLPGCALRVIDPATNEEMGIDEDGLLIVSGPNVMNGYLNNEEKTKEVLMELDDKTWYKTGDKGHLDSDGFITIVDRYSRFAKIGGEMVSLSAVEGVLHEALAKYDLKIVCTNIPDDKKGEKIVLLIDKDIDGLKDELNKIGLNPLWIPSVIKVVDEMPLLGSGKVDIKGAKALALEG
jgi:acyl-[acyl-carrier-protein]-phospholipid O-acyltransferase/long-chain-fatty-acid--[acyl-carrier-protein] ligase